MFFFLFLSLFFILPVLAQGPPPAPTPTKAKCDIKELESELARQGTKDFQPSAILPLCVYFEGTTMEKDCGCRNVNTFIDLLIKIANWLFMLVGAAALVMFIYGGFVFLTSGGSSEKVTKGKTILISAVIGLIIIFMAQFGVQFLLKTLVQNSKERVTGLEINMGVPSK